MAWEAGVPVLAQLVGFPGTPLGILAADFAPESRGCPVSAGKHLKVVGVEPR